jgi:hypothetical protein
MKLCKRKPPKRQAKAGAPDLFDWSRETELLTYPVIRTVVSQAKVSPALALTIAELSGLMRGHP